VPRKTRDERIDTRTARLKLEIRREPYWHGIQEGRAVGYRRLDNGKAGTWSARFTTPGTPNRQFRALGSADDYAPADGTLTLTYAQAQDAAQDFFDECLRNQGRKLEPVTVEEAAANYITAYKARGGKAEKDTQRTIQAHISPSLGKLLLSDLTTRRLNNWRDAVASAPARLRSGPKTKTRKVRVATGHDARRARRATANRVLTVLKAILNHAYANGYVTSDDAWRRVKPFAGVDAPKIRYLIDAESIRLINACPEDFRQLVSAALLTGCRYGELTQLHAADIDLQNKLVHIRQAKGAKPRTAYLTDEGVTHFKNLLAGKRGDALILTRNDGQPWGKSHQVRPLLEACKNASIAPAISFHILRHTYASRLAMKGVPMAVIAAGLGNSETICAKHYAHLSPTYIGDSLRAGFGTLGIVQPNAKVQNIALGASR
jgi:integrase